VSVELVIESKVILQRLVPILYYMVRRMKATITQIESTVTPSGNSGHIVVPKAWIGKEAIVTLKDKENKTKGRR
jgi:putative transposon-encoded protein